MPAHTFTKGQRVRVSEKYPYGFDKVGTIIGLCAGERLNNGEAYKVLWDGSAKPSFWHENFLTLADADATNRGDHGPA